ncbi:hypothetical protein LZ30DRAFT_268061 [Colletotrichum cereale]|nr:hypothetical protein LZ30DRAFT_268061 [Colletotrichum cereale]
MRDSGRATVMLSYLSLSLSLSPSLSLTLHITLSISDGDNGLAGGGKRKGTDNQPPTRLPCLPLQWEQATGCMRRFATNEAAAGPARLSPLRDVKNHAPSTFPSVDIRQDKDISNGGGMLWDAHTITLSPLHPSRRAWCVVGPPPPDSLGGGFPLSTTHTHTHTHTHGKSLPENYFYGRAYMHERRNGKKKEGEKGRKGRNKKEGVFCGEPRLEKRPEPRYATGCTLDEKDMQCNAMHPWPLDLSSHLSNPPPGLACNRSRSLQTFLSLSCVGAQ